METLTHRLTYGSHFTFCGESRKGDTKTTVKRSRVTCEKCLRKWDAVVRSAESRAPR